LKQPVSGPRSASGRVSEYEQKHQAKGPARAKLLAYRARVNASPTTLADEPRTSYRHLLSAETRAELERREGRR